MRTVAHGLSRRQKGSRRREKQRLRVARAHARVRQERQCALHALTTRLVRDLRVDAGDACPEDILVQVLADEARSGQRNRACLEQVRFR